jgi:hypothetical protein
MIRGIVHEASLVIRLVLAIAAAALAAGCASPPSRLEPRARSPARGTPGASVAVERVARYYVDETGTLWDDRGRKYDGAQDPAPDVAGGYVR